MHVNQLVPTNLVPSTCPRHSAAQSSHHPGGLRSVHDLFQVQKAQKSTEEEHKEGWWPMVCVFHIGMAPCDIFKRIFILKYDESNLCSVRVVVLSAVDLDMSSASITCTLLPSLPARVPAFPSPDTSRAESAGKWNGLHSLLSVQSRLNLSIEVPSPSQVHSDHPEYNQKTLAQLALQKLLMNENDIFHFSA